ncbi:MAG: SHOCT domain-containing protein [Sphaerochaeta sp.]
MKRILVLTLVVLFLIVGTTLWAQEEGHGRSADVIINEIKQTQGVGSITQIKSDQVSPALLEELGDAVMGLMIADEQQHEWMDEMMGGEGSEQLSSTHRWIAYNYLQNDGTLGTWGSTMMGYGMGGPGMMGNWNLNRQGNLNWPNSDWGYGPGSMMSWSGNWWGWIVIFILIVVIAVVIIALFRSRRGGSTSSSEALEILRRRYAEGKISKEEYLLMSKELKE